MCKRFEQAGVSAGREDGQGVEERPCVGAEPRGTGEHGISNGLRHLVGERRQHLGDEERVPGGQPVKLVGICRARIGKDANGAAGERPHPDAANAGNRRQASEDDAKRIVPAEFVVAIRHDEKRSKPFDPAGDETNDVERGLVCPMDIFQQDDRRRDPRELFDRVPRRSCTGLIRCERGRPELPPIVRATSTNGPSGRGMKSGSHAPVSTRVFSAASAQKLRTSALLPTPASPATSTRRPDPAHTSEKDAASAASSVSRSSRSDLTAAAIPGS